MNISQEVGFTDTQRTRESARNFVRGFVSRDNITLPPPVTDQV